LGSRVSLFPSIDALIESDCSFAVQNIATSTFWLSLARTTEWYHGIESEPNTERWPAPATTAPDAWSATG
jgi:hypothetical protein